VGPHGHNTESFPIGYAGTVNLVVQKDWGTGHYIFNDIFLNTTTITGRTGNTTKPPSLSIVAYISH